MTINVQCVYGDDDIENVRNCIIPNLAAATKEKVVFLTMNYDAAGKRLDSGDQYGCEVRDIPKTTDRRTGFAENHNFLFKESEKTPSFVLINPDCVPLPGSIDRLIERKTDKVAIVEGRQWPFEHPKKYDQKTLETPWASGAFELIDSDFYQSVGGMHELYFLYAEDVDLSWRAWLKGYRVLYEPAAQIIHFTNGRFERDDLISNEQYYGLRNFILISRKFFGKKGEESAVKSLKKALDPYLFTKIMDDYLTNIRDRITDTYDGKRDRHIMIRGINQFAD